MNETKFPDLLALGGRSFGRPRINSCWGVGFLFQNMNKQTASRSAASRAEDTQTPLEKWLRSMPADCAELRVGKSRVSAEWWPMIVAIMARQHASFDAVVAYILSNAPLDEFICELSNDCSDEKIGGVYGTLKRRSS
jgi:hypothetical protein